MVLNNAVLLVSEAARGIVLSTLFTYLAAVIAAGGSAPPLATATAAAVSLFSVGRLLANYSLGYVADYAQLRSVFVLCLLLHALGQLLYTTGYASGVAGLLASRLLTGFGSGVLGVCRAFVAATEPPATRTRQYAFLGISKFVGYALTPGFALLFGGVNFIALGSRFDAFTSPGYFMMVACLLLAACVARFMSPVSTSSSAPAAAAAALAAGGGGTAAATVELPPSHVRASSTPAATGSIDDAQLVVVDDVDTHGTMSSTAAESTKSRTTRAAAATAAADSCAPVCAPVHALPSRDVNARGRALEPTTSLLIAPAATAAAPSLLARCASACSSPFGVGVCLFVLLNLVTKGVLTLMEAMLAPAFGAVYVDADGTDASDMIADTTEFILLLGVGGLITYAAIAMKPSGTTAGSAVPVASASVEQQRAGGDAASAAAAAPATATPSSPQSTIAIDQRSTPPVRSSHATEFRRYVHSTLQSSHAAWRRCVHSRCALLLHSTLITPLGYALHPRVWDAALLLLSLCITALGAFLASPPLSRLSLAQMSTGFALIWSVGAPIADVLTTSMFSVLVTRYGRKQGRAQG